MTLIVQRYPTPSQFGTEDAARLWDLRAAAWAGAVLKWAHAGPQYADCMTEAFTAMQDARRNAAWHRAGLESPMP